MTILKPKENAYGLSEEIFERICEIIDIVKDRVDLDAFLEYMEAIKILLDGYCDKPVE